MVCCIMCGHKNEITLKMNLKILYKHQSQVFFPPPFLGSGSPPLLGVVRALRPVNQNPMEGGKWGGSLPVSPPKPESGVLALAHSWFEQFLF